MQIREPEEAMQEGWLDYPFESPSSHLDGILTGIETDRTLFPENAKRRSFFEAIFSGSSFV